MSVKPSTSIWKARGTELGQLCLLAKFDAFLIKTPSCDWETLARIERWLEPAWRGSYQWDSALQTNMCFQL